MQQTRLQASHRDRPRLSAPPDLFEDAAGHAVYLTACGCTLSWRQLVGAESDEEFSRLCGYARA
jgi:hypothetical protein